MKSFGYAGHFSDLSQHETSGRLNEVTSVIAVQSDGRRSMAAVSVVGSVRKEFPFFKKIKKNEK
jgi:hypothetical protein